MWIVLHHFWPQTSGVTPHLITKGYLAVDLFFILSGLVLYLVYEPAIRAGSFNIGRFALKRFARLYPVHLVTLCCAVAILWLGPRLGFSGRELPYDLGKMVMLHLSLLHAWGITETGGLNYPSWSLSAEAFAYLLFPTLGWIVLRSRHALVWSVVILVSSVVLFEWLWPDSLRNASDALVFTRFENDFGVLRIVPEFILGMSIAKALPRLSHGSFWLWAGGLQIIAGLLWDFDVLSVLGFAAILAGCALRDPRTSGSLHKLGQISYCLYMCHALVQIVGFKLIETTLQYEDSAVPSSFLIPMLITSIICAAVLHLWVERPAQRWILSFSATTPAVPKAAHCVPR